MCSAYSSTKVITSRADDIVAGVSLTVTQTGSNLAVSFTDGTTTCGDGGALSDVSACPSGTVSDANPEASCKRKCGPVLWMGLPPATSMAPLVLGAMAHAGPIAGAMAHAGPIAGASALTLGCPTSCLCPAGWLRRCGFQRQVRPLRRWHLVHRWCLHLLRRRHLQQPGRRLLLPCLRHWHRERRRYAAPRLPRFVPAPAEWWQSVLEWWLPCTQPEAAWHSWDLKGMSSHVCWQQHQVSVARLLPLPTVPGWL